MEIPDVSSVDSQLIQDHMLQELVMNQSTSNTKMVRFFIKNLKIILFISL